MFEKKWTVLGVWFQDEPYAVGSVEGDQLVYGGDSVQDGMTGFQGPWSVTVEAADAEVAESKAEALMQATLDDDDDDEETV